jgi:hypothetical protein
MAEVYNKHAGSAGWGKVGQVDGPGGRSPASTVVYCSGM